MRHTTALLTAALLLAVTGCSSDDSSSDGKPAAKPKPSPTVSEKDQYLKAAHSITFNGAPSDTGLSNERCNQGGWGY